MSDLSRCAELNKTHRKSTSPSYRTLHLRGLCLGRVVAVSYRLRDDAATIPKNPHLFWGTQCVEIDDLKMDRRMLAALPHAYLTVTDASAWEPFVREMIAAGRL